MQSIKAFELYFLLENHAISFQYLKLQKNSLSVRTDSVLLYCEKAKPTFAYSWLQGTTLDNDADQFWATFDFLVLFLFP